MVRENSAAGARDPAAARRARRPPTSAPSCSASWAARRPTSASCWPRSSQTDDQNFDAALRLLLRASWRRRWSCTGCASATSLTIKAFTRSRLRAVGQREGLRDVPVPGAGEVDAGGRAEPDGPGVVPRALRLPDAARSWPRSRSCRRRRARATSAARTPRPSCSATQARRRRRRRAAGASSDRDARRRPGDARSRRVAGRQAAARRGAQPRLPARARSSAASC